MNRRNRFFTVAALLAALLLIGVGTTVLAQQPTNPPDPTGSAASKDPSKITPALRQQFAAAAPGAQMKYWVVLKDQADTRNNIPTSQWADKGWYVYNTLRAKADSTQGPVLAQLDSLKKAGQVTELTSYWIINSIIASGDLDSAATVAANPAVAMVKELGTYQIFDAPAQLSDAAAAVYNQARLDSVAQTRWNAPFIIQHNQNEVRAPQAWAAGYDGTGITVGSMDTGTRWTHEALNARYRGVVAPPDPSNIHDYNWFDGYNAFTTPTDNNGHGSHTMGTIIGTSPNATYGNIGTAPNAMWITVRICATSSCDLQPILNGFQWTLAPTRVNGTQANPALRPRISSNSWGNSNCSTPDFQTGVTNWVNAGIFPDFATGNSGPGVGSVGAPASYVNAWGTGNLNTSSSNWVINSSSSRGPSCFDGSIRPQAIAPGTSICSSINTSDTAYSCAYTGTSMATPHIAGAVAILQQKNPNLTIAQYMYALTSTAFFSPTWGTRPNNNYGWGLIQIDDALNSIPSQGTPTPTATGTPPTATQTRTPTITPTATATTNPCLLQNYTVATGTATIVPGTTNIGSACDDCDTPITLPFPFVLYGQTFNSVNASSNGRLDFVTVNEPGGYSNACLPAPPNLGPYDYTIFAHWDDLRTDAAGSGIFTSVSGTAPNRIFNIEWRATYFSGTGTANFEVRLYEGQSRFDLVYGTLGGGGTGATTGVQGPGTRFTQYSCNTALASGLLLSFTLPSCTTPTVGPSNTPTTLPTTTRTPTTVASPTNTAVPTSAASSTATVTATVTACPVQFVDVPASNTFYTFIRCLACRGIVGGYPCGGPNEPCPGTYYRPNNNVTRGQTAKIISESAGFAEVIPSTQQTFEDVAPGSTFHLWIERLSGRGIIQGYPCGGPFEPCVAPTNRPYFRPGNNVTRGQLSKITSGAAGWTETPTGQTFEDVPVGSTFYVYIERMAARGIISGYPCGGPFEPCIGPGNRPYFRPNNNATRGQMAKIAAQAFFPNCATPDRPR